MCVRPQHRLRPRRSWSTTRPWTPTCTTRPRSRASRPTWSGRLAAAVRPRRQGDPRHRLRAGRVPAGAVPHAGATGFGYDAMYAGVEGPDPSGAHFTTGFAPLRDPALPDVRLRHVAALVRAHRRPVRLPRRAARARRRPAGVRLLRGARRRLRPGDRGLGGDLPARVLLRRRTSLAASSSGPAGGSPTAARCSRACSASSSSPANPAVQAAPRRSPIRRARDRQLAAIGGFAERQRGEIAAGGRRSTSWQPKGAAGAVGRRLARRAVPDVRGPRCQLAAVVDVNPRKWGRYLPMTAHRVDSPETLREIEPADGHHHQPRLQRRDRQVALRSRCPGRRSLRLRFVFA